jgi:26S proteasome regulatory subunit N3
MEDVVMSDLTTKEETLGKETSAKDTSPLHQDYKRVMMNLEKAVTLKDSKTLYLYSRLLNKFRRGFTEEDCQFLVDNFLRSKFNFSFIPSLDVKLRESYLNKFNLPQKLTNRLKDLPEFFLYNYLIVLEKLVDKKLYQEAFDSLGYLISYLKQNDSLTIQHLRAKSYYYYALVAEKLNKYGGIIQELHNAYRKACLDIDEITQVTLINCIVRNYLNNNAVEQARNFLSKTKFHENVSVNEDARYLFYLGKINAIQMNYSEAYIHLTNSLRKAPEKCATGFKTIVQKLLIIVELLMGEVPDITTFTATSDMKIMKPYLDLIKAVKQGNLDDFKNALTTYENSFISDKNYTLILRLRHIVIKIGLRKINLSYSRISLKDITEKLKLESGKETEYIIAKAIRDGVFLAKINHDEGYVQSMVIYFFKFLF